MNLACRMAREFAGTLFQGAFRGGDVPVVSLPMVAKPPATGWHPSGMA